METILMELNKTPGIVGSFIISSDGMIIASDYTTEVDDERFGAIISSIINATEKAVKQMECGQINGFVVETNQVKIYFQHFKLGYLVTMAVEDANLGLVRVETRSAAAKLETIGHADA